MVPKRKLHESIPLHFKKLNCGKGVYKLEYHVEEEALNSYLLSKLKPIKRIPPIDFLICLL
jgi:hypothetical protein